MADLLVSVKRKPEHIRETRALDAGRVELVLRQISDPRDRALFWLIYDGGLRFLAAQAIDIEDISWPDRSIAIHGKGDRPREKNISRCQHTARQISDHARQPNHWAALRHPA
ncbi:hypothetical protein EPA93_16740 [Ktedonosporobacter rubrisoli]|uniref:Tyr recombinase domain-containing protein n=1 Tax=Ktedonosporobacter rubrisoli TaxID=2509675 RepID=A0A4P6JQ60_KTERU|nr:hypothetical protein [Ktedonosporobacter rubrisoli]QBD77548.1 hypothetical protein EPA93_16740 [Ktedonosporobacter rubrisoli]